MKSVITDIDQFCLQYKKMEKEKIIRQVIFFQYQLYQEVDQLIKSFHQDPKYLDPMLEQLQNIHSRLVKLHHLHREYPFLYFYQFDLPLVPEADRENPELFFATQYHHFLEVCLKVSNPQHRLHLAVLVRQLLSIPSGQKLIVDLNTLNIQRGCQILAAATAPMDNMSVTPIDLESKNKSSTIFKTAQKKFTQVNLAYSLLWEQSSASYITSFNFGKTKILSQKLMFASLGHELIHALQFFQGQAKIHLKLPDRHPHIQFLYMDNAEEFQTIEKENQLRKEYQISTRGSHIRAMQFNQGEYSLREFKKTMKEIPASPSPQKRKGNPEFILLEIKPKSRCPACCIL